MRQKLESHFGLIMAVIIIIMILPRYMSSPQTEYDSIKFEQAVGALTPGTSVKLTDITPFEWETCYTFDPYTSKEEIEKIIGFSSNSVREAKSEGMVQLLFVKGEEVTASECAYPEDIGYTVDLKGRKEISAAEDPVFAVTKKDDLVVLTLTE